MTFSSQFKKPLKETLIDEIKWYSIYAIFLAILFIAVLTSRRLILEQYSINTTHYSFAIIEALILAKIIRIGQIFGFGERFLNKPLIYPVIYKTIIFSSFVIIFQIIEHFIVGFIHKKEIITIYHELIAKGIFVILANIINMIFVFFFLFAFLEIGRILGHGKLIALFFRRNKFIHSEKDKGRS